MEVCVALTGRDRGGEEHASAQERIEGESDGGGGVHGALIIGADGKLVGVFRERILQANVCLLWITAVNKSSALFLSKERVKQSRLCSEA